MTLDDLDIYGHGVDVDVGAPRDRDGLPEAQPVPDDVDLRQRRRRPEARRDQGRRTRTRSSSARCAAPACGTRSRTACRSRASASPAASSSASASRARSPSQPEVILMDEPCSALDPIATLKVEELILELKKDFTIIIVTHNMQQAARVSDTTAFFYLGELIEHAPTEKLFSTPSDTRVPRSTSPASSADAGHGPGPPALPGADARARARRCSRRSTCRSRSSTASSTRCATATSRSRSSSSPTTTASTAATSRSTRASCRCSRSRRRSPGDLRLVTAVLHVIKNIERIGDQCANIAKLIPLRRHDDAACASEIFDRILRMGALARDELVQARAGVRRAQRRAGRGARPSQDEEINRLNREVFRLAVEAGEDAELREWAMLDDARRARARAHRRQRRRHRRADDLRRERAVPRVLRLVDPSLVAVVQDRGAR